MMNQKKKPYLIEKKVVMEKQRNEIYIRYKKKITKWQTIFSYHLDEMQTKISN